MFQFLFSQNCSRIPFTFFSQNVSTSRHYQPFFRRCQPRCCLSLIDF
ncbi:hypothetical protein MtrunA17_Chr3g0113881 [Medicago truncatula]|uniref:Uncharacterized protein n=1 Tax=Medicago truncatula TaxID=3880 RepID=A0A396IWN3_MEDTR|nr:hypothetical protein MtrunA17_Chr3g0113881 [Medicago truncatula]